jgi:hypothetical protein
VTSETLFTLKLDYHQSEKDSYWFRFQLNDGTNTQADPVNSIFDTVLPVSIRSGSAGWTHVFNATLVNQFNPGLTYRSAISNAREPANAHAAMPITYAPTPFSAMGTSLSSTPNGTADTVWQLIDNLTWVRSKHQLKLGANLRRTLSTFVNGSSVTPTVYGYSFEEFTYGAAYTSSQSFPERLEDRLSALNLDLYAMDTYKATRRLTLSYGLRVALNSNPESQNRLISRLNGSFSTISHDVNRPLNADILANQRYLYASRPPVQWQPRVGIAYALRPNTVLRAGFGVFGDVLDGGEPALREYNPPTNDNFAAGLSSPLGGIAIVPGVPNDVVDVAVAANQQFLQNFSSGALSCASALSSPGNCLPSPGIFYSNGSGNGRPPYPYSMQWSLGVQQQLWKTFGLTAKYVGTRGVKNTFVESPNTYQTTCDGCFAPIPFNVAPDPRFSYVYESQAVANSSYHALQTIAEKQMSHGLSLQFNYTYSHCLDFTSNQNITFNANSANTPFPGELKRYYSNCDYDIRHSVNGSYIYQLPFRSSQRWFNATVSGWQVSGTAFLRGGLPFSVFGAYPFYAGIQNSFPTLFADAVPGQNPYQKTAVNGVTLPGARQWLNPDAFQSTINVDPLNVRNTSACFSMFVDPQHCQDGNLRRNSFRAPSFRWFDFAVSRQFKIREKITLKLDAQFYNVFNHPNLGFPNGGKPIAGIPGDPATETLSLSPSAFGGITSTVSPGTGLLGSGLGGDSSPRMIAVRGRIEF